MQCAANFGLRVKKTNVAFLEQNQKLLDKYVRFRVLACYGQKD